jgi:hypothetical protein
MIVSSAQEASGRTRVDAFRSTLVDPTVTALQTKTSLPRDVDGNLEVAFCHAAEEAGAHVGLLHRRGDAFMYTIGVHGLDRGLHMLVWVSMWDPAMQAMLRGQTLVGSSEKSVEHATVARRLQSACAPGHVVAVPVMVGDSVEAVVELGRFRSGFSRGIEFQVLATMQDVASGRRRASARD